MEDNSNNTRGAPKLVRPIMRDPLFLAGKSEPATEADKQVVQDLLDTLKANQDRCVGMAAGPFMFAMINAKIELDHVDGIVI